MSIKTPEKRNRPRINAAILISSLLAVLLLASPVYETLVVYSRGAVAQSVHFWGVPARRIADRFMEVTTRTIQGIWPNREQGLPMVQLFVSEQAQRALVSDPPASISKWQKAHIVYPDGKLRPIKVRHRGDANPINYQHSKKSWRIKTKRKSLINKQRIINYILPKSEDMIDEYISLWIAKEMGILSPKIRLVELFINNISNGIYFEQEHIGESFLRSNNLMPVNLYKGDEDRGGLKDVSYYLFNSPPLWRKLAVGNNIAPEDKGDLETFLRLVRDAGSDRQAFDRLTDMAPFDVWARYSAFQILAQSWHNDHSHNMRLIIDDHSGKVLPIAWDIRSEWSSSEIRTELDSHPLFTVYRQDSGFLLQEMRFLYSYLANHQILKRSHYRIDDLREKFRPSLRRDAGRHAIVDELPRAARLWLDPEATYQSHDKMKAGIAKLEALLYLNLETTAGQSWEVNQSGIDMYVSAVPPLSNLVLELSPKSAKPNAMALDINGNDRIDQADVDLPFRVIERRVEVDAIWLANRGLTAPSKHFNDAGKFTYFGMEVVPTKFKLITDTPLHVLSVTASNELTGEKFSLSRGRQTAAVPFQYNRPVMEKRPPAEVVWRGAKRFSETKVIENPVRIEAGTNIVLEPGVSLIFRNTLIIEGTRERPVRISGDRENPWGTFALLGENTRGSRLGHLIIEDGSGARVDGVTYSAMLSLHDTRDVDIGNLKMHRNHRRDDMLHIVYSTDIVLHDIELTDARSDAIDIDISSVEIRNVTIRRSGNDCIDLMTSTVLMNRLRLSNCGDKAISVGEGSTAAVVDAVLRSSGIGVAAKDGSQIQLLHVDFIDNKSQANAYQKNWRYGAGGRIEIFKSRMQTISGENRLEADKKSRLRVFDSSLVGGIRPHKNVDIDSASDQRTDRLAASDGYGYELLSMLDAMDLSPYRRRRGSISP